MIRLDKHRASMQGEGASVAVGAAESKPKSSSAAAGRSVAIVGAGPGGLGTAMLLAAKNIDVTVYEAAPTVGGRTTRLSLASASGDQYHFDTGPTFFLMPYVLDEIFAATGRRLGDYVKLTQLDPMYRLVMGRAGQSPLTIDCTQNIPEMCRRIEQQIDPRDGKPFAKFISDNRQKLTAFEPVLRKPFRTVADLFDPKLIAALPYLGPTRSVYQDLSARFHSEYTKLITSFQSKYLGMSPMNCPSLFTILPFIEYEYGIWHPQGGCNRLMTAMADVCREMGVKIKLGQPVERITFSGRRATGVVVDSMVQPHEHVVLNADASWAIKNLIPADLRRGPMAWSDKKLDGMGYSCSTFMLYAGLSDKVDLPHHTIYISEKYKDNLADISSRGVLSHDPSMYFCNATVTDDSIAPAGHSAIYGLLPAPNVRDGKINWPAETAGLRKAMLGKLADLCGRDVEREITTERVFTPETWQGRNINFGATFNLAHNLTQMLMLRPQHELAGVENVWLAGGGTHPGSGLPVIFLSCQIAAGRIAARLGCASPSPAVQPRPAFSPTQAQNDARPRVAATA